MAYTPIPAGGISSLTANAVVFGDASGAATSSSDFTWDNTAKTLLVRNATNSAGQNAKVRAEVGGTSGGNPIFEWNIPSGTSWSAQVNNGTSDRWELLEGSTVRMFASAGGRTHMGTNPTGSASGTFTVGRHDAVSYSAIEAFNDQAASFAQLRCHNSNANNLLDMFAHGSTSAGTFLGSNNTSTVALRANASLFKIGTLSNHNMELGTNDTRRLLLDNAGNVVPGTAAIATTATDGYIYSQSCAGAPTGAPTAYAGRVPMVYDSTNNRIYFYNGSWRSVAVT